MPSAGGTPGSRDAATKKIGTILAAPRPIIAKPSRLAHGAGHSSARLIPTKASQALAVSVPASLQRARARSPVKRPTAMPPENAA